MSKIAITPNVSGTGTVTITSPNTNIDRTLVLPDATGTVNISGSANEVPAGSAGAPAIYPTGDTNTGIFFPSADTVAISTGGTQRFTVDASGTVDATTLSIGGTAITATAAELNFVDGVTSAIQTQLDAKAPLASPALTGTPTAPTASVGTNTTQVATTAFVNAEIANDITGKADLASPAFTGVPTAPTATVGTNTTQLATTAFVIANAGSLDSPAFTGTPTAPTASVGTNTTQLATTAFVNAEIANDAPTKTGGGASGTWGIAISGNAATATSLSTDRTNWSSNGTIDDVVGQLAWKNYGNNHTIFDASNSTSPNGGGVNNTNAQIAWTGTYPTLMGWNGANTYGVRVDSARVADSTTGNASTVSTITTAQVLAAEAGASAGAVGSYAYCTRAGNSSTYTIGSTIGGGDLRYSNANGLNSGTPGGTWRCMGYAAGTPNSVNTTTLWLRIS